VAKRLSYPIDHIEADELAAKKYKMIKWKCKTPNDYWIKIIATKTFFFQNL
jgi:hypothetical protein